MCFVCSVCVCVLSGVFYVYMCVCFECVCRCMQESFYIAGTKCVARLSVIIKGSDMHSV